MRMLLLAAVMTWHVASSGIVSRNVHNGTEAVVEDEVSELFEREQYESIVTLSDRLFKAITEDASGNLVYAPEQLFTILSTVFSGIADDNDKQIQSLIEDRYAIAFSRKLKSMENNYQECKGVQLRSEKYFFLAKSFKLHRKIVNAIISLHGSYLKIVNFDDPVEASKNITEWIASHTRNRARDLVQPADLNGMTSLVIVNTVYFTGDWFIKFNEKETTMRPFYVNGTSVRNVSTMHRVDNYRYGELTEVKAKFIELPYKTNWRYGKVSMFIILPDEVDGLSELKRNFEKVTIQKLNEGEESNVELYLPKFKIENTIDLDAPLGRLRLADIFGNSANFNGITDEAPLKISKFVQANFINVNEQGTDAASDTEPQIESNRLHNVTFLVDHPFVSVIVTEHAVPLFTAVIVDPISEI